MSNEKILAFAGVTPDQLTTGAEAYKARRAADPSDTSIDAVGHIDLLLSVSYRKRLSVKALSL